MGSNVLTNLPPVPSGKGRRGLICAGHAVAPEPLPPGALSVECRRCGRPVVLARTPLPPEDPPTRFAEELNPPPPPSELVVGMDQTNAVVAVISAGGASFAAEPTVALGPPGGVAVPWSSDPLEERTVRASIVIPPEARRPVDSGE